MQFVEKENGGMLMFKKISKILVLLRCVLCLFGDKQEETVMKKNTRKKSISFIAIVCVSIISTLCGCAETPNVRDENGIDYAVRESDEIITNIIENDTKNENEYLVEGEGENKCVYHIGNTDSVINIDAVVNGLNVETISLQQAEPFPNAIDKEKVIDIFFGGEANVLENNRKEENNINQGKSGERAVVQKMETTGQMFLDSVDGSIHFTQTSYAGFDYRNDKLVAEYKQIEIRGGYSEEQNKDISDSYTVDMAKQSLLETFSKFMNTEVQIISCTSIYNEIGNGFYEFIFVPMIENLPLAVNDRETNTDHIVDVYGRAQIGKEGIALIETNNFLWRSNSIPNDSEMNCLNLGKILEILEEYVTKGEISGSEKITFTRVSLVWLPVTEDWTEAELVPVWRFYIPCAELIESGMMDISIIENVPTDICINAINGKIEIIQ